MIGKNFIFRNVIKEYGYNAECEIFGKCFT